MCACVPDPKKITLSLPSNRPSILIVCKNGFYSIPPKAYYGSGYLLTKKSLKPLCKGLNSQEFLKEIYEGKVKLEDVCTAWAVTPTVRELEDDEARKKYGNVIDELNKVGNEVISHYRKYSRVYTVNWGFRVFEIDYELVRLEIDVIKKSNYYVVFNVRKSESIATTTAGVTVFQSDAQPDAVASDLIQYVPVKTSLKGVWVKKPIDKRYYAAVFKQVRIAPPAHVLLGIDPFAEPEKVEGITADLEELDIDLGEWEGGEGGAEKTETENTAVTTEEKTTTETEEEEKEIDVNELALRWIKEKGLIPATLVVFDLPSEYRGAKTKVKKVGDGYEEVRELRADMTKFRTLRSLFYKELRKVAWRSTTGWVMMQYVRKPDLDALNGIVEKLNELAGFEKGEERVVEFIQVFLPRHYVINQLKKYIAEKKASFEEFKRKAEEVKEKRTQYKRLVAAMEEVKEIIKDLEAELKYLKEEY